MCSTPQYSDVSCSTIKRCAVQDCKAGVSMTHGQPSLVCVCTVQPQLHSSKLHSTDPNWSALYWTKTMHCTIVTCTELYGKTAVQCSEILQCSVVKYCTAVYWNTALYCSACLPLVAGEARHARCSAALHCNAAHSAPLHCSAQCTVRHCTAQCTVQHCSTAVEAPVGCRPPSRAHLTLRRPGSVGEEGRGAVTLDMWDLAMTSGCQLWNDKLWI